MSSVERSPGIERAPVKPQPVDIPWAPVPSSVTVTASDADQSIALWNRDMPEYDGVLEAELTGE